MMRIGRMTLAAALLWLASGCDDAGSTSGAEMPVVDMAMSIDAAADAATDAGMALPPDAALADGAVTDRTRLLSVPESARFALPGLSSDVHVIRTEFDIPHIFAQNPTDLARVHGFVMARDRFWMMDLGRRLGKGTLSELFGDLVVGSDITSRARGFTVVAERAYAHVSDARRVTLDAFAAGINDYIAAVADGVLPPPSELALFYGLLGAGSPAELMMPWTGADVAAFGSVVIDRSACNRSELANAAAVSELADRDDARAEAILRDLVLGLRPIVDTTTVPDRIPTARHQKAESEADPPTLRATTRASTELVSTLARRLRAAMIPGRLISGSNAWAVAPAGTTDGATLVAGDGHLDLTVPSFFHQAGLDTGVLGGEPWHVRGNFVAGLPPLGVGTNGHVAWSFTCFYSDTIDYFDESLRLGADGLPDASRFREEWRPVTRIDETYETRALPALSRPQTTRVEPSFILFDGRRVLTIEGRPAADGEMGIDLGDGPIIPGDVDGDGIVSAISIDASYLDIAGSLGAYYDIGDARTLDELRAAHRRLVVFGSHFVAGDKDGHIMATGYHAAPCRNELPRSADGLSYAPGADPRLLLDGTRFGGFTIDLNADGTVNEASPDPAACVVPYADFPQVSDPPSHYVVSANNDPAGSSLDGSLANDVHYIGGPWSVGFRAERIDALVAAAAAEGRADVATMAAVQADNRSAVGARWSPHVIAAIEGAQARIADPGGSPSEIRISALYGAHSAALDAVAQRLSAWAEDGYRTPSGVETFYESPTPTDIESSIATMIFHAWASHFIERVFGDESLPSAEYVTGVQNRARIVDRILRARGEGGDAGLVSWDPQRRESIFFDDVMTEEVETGDEMILLGLVDALTLLATPPESPGVGGFGTADMTAWRWGLRHMVIYESILAPFVAGIEGIDGLFASFGIAPDTVRLTPDRLPATDPRAGLPGFPRGGDNFSVDVGQSGFRRARHDYKAGPVKRMVIALHPDGRVEGQNILPGGQSGLSESPHFSDQVRQWLGNDAAPLRFHLPEIVEGAVGREVYAPR